MKAGTIELVKFKKLQRRLSLSLYEAAGVLEMLWSVTARNAPQGDIGAKLDNEDIAIAIGWEGDPDELVRVLVDTRWLDECETNRLVVHNWDRHCPTYVAGNLRSRNLEFAVASAPCPERDAIAGGYSGSLGEGQQDAIAGGYSTRATKSGQVKSSQARSGQVKPSQVESADPGGSERCSPADIDEVLDHYHAYHPLGKQHASEKSRRLVRDRLREGHSVDDLREAIDGCHRSPFHLGDNERNRKYLDLGLILRDAEHVQKFREVPENPDAPVAPNAHERRRMRALGALDPPIVSMDRLETTHER